MTRPDRVLGDDWRDGAGPDDGEPVESNGAGLTPEPPFKVWQPIVPAVVDALDLTPDDLTGADPLLGGNETGTNLIPIGTDAMIYGDGAVGKSTLAIDLAVHLAAGTTWLGLTVPRPLRVLLVEAEGSKPGFFRKVQQRLGASDQPPRGIVLWREPWRTLNLLLPQHRGALSDVIREQSIDLVIIGPLSGIGFDGPGTARECREFNDVLEHVRGLSGRLVSFLLIHHENKAGGVSGAWSAVGDALLHLVKDGVGRRRLVFAKARHASALQDATWHLAFADGQTFERIEVPDQDDDAVLDAIRSAVGDNPGAGSSEIEEHVRRVAKASKARLRGLRDQLLEAGEVVNVGRGEVVLDHVPERTRARLYLASDPHVQILRPDGGADGAQTW